MGIKRKPRLPNGTLGQLESVRGLPDIDPNLLIAFDAIAAQNELLSAQQKLIDGLKAEVETLKGGTE